MKKIYLGLLIGLFSITIHAQDLYFAWAKSISGPDSDDGQSITTDASGNIYITGTFENTVDFDPGIGTFNITSNGMKDVFIQKLDASGSFIWAISVGGTNNDYSNCITTDVSGNVYITGYYRDTVDFDPSSATLNFVSNGLDDIFIQKLDANGNLMWAKSMGALSADRGTSLTADAFGAIYTTGYYRDTVDFDPGPATFNLISNNTDIFIQKLDLNGNFIWSKSVGGTNPDYGYAVTTDAIGNVYVTGSFVGTANFDPGVATFNLTSIGSVDIFILKLSSSGNFIWANSFGGTEAELPNFITADTSGVTYITGFYEATVDFDPGAGTFNLNSNGGRDIFILKLDSDGNFIWAKSMGGTSEDLGNSITTDASGNVYSTGSFIGSVDFDPGAGTFVLTSNALIDVFIQKLDADGNFVWAKSVGNRGNSIHIDNTGNAYVTGNYIGTVDFDPGLGTFYLTSNSFDAFILKLSSTGVRIEESILFNNVSIFPNPIGSQAGPYQELVNVELGNLKKVSISVFTISGRLIYHMGNINSSIHQIELNEAQGIYIIEVSSQTKKQQFKLVKY